MTIVEYDPGAAFPGVIGRTAEESSPAWPAPVRAEEGAPNVLFIVLDDTGFGQLGCYGSPIETPNLDGIAANGLRYNSMHTTALCSPSRSCIISGRNHHSNGMAAITELATGFPGYNGIMPFENGLLSEILVEQGYSTLMVGKWHLTPSNQETAAGPYDRWPLGRGFQRFYGFLGGDTSQWYPDLVYDNHQVEPPRTPEEGYHLSEDLVDKAVSFIADTKQVDPEKPFYLHLCFGATHAPHHVAKEWADKYKGVFDDGWDAYREKDVRAPEGARHRARRTPSCRATIRTSPTGTPSPRTPGGCTPGSWRCSPGSSSHTDAPDRPAARVPGRSSGELDNTLIMVISDNGASAEGGPTGTTNEAQFFNNAQEPIEESLEADRRDRRPEALQPLPVGLDVGGQHAVPPLEARDLPRRLDRSVHRLLAEGDQGARARSAPSTPTSSTWCRPSSTCSASSRPPQIRGVTQAPMHGVSFAHTLDDAEAPSQPPHPVLRDVRPPVDLPRRLAGGLPVAGRRRSPRRASRFGEPITAEMLSRARRDGLGAVPRRRGLRGEPRTSPPRTATS